MTDRDSTARLRDRVGSYLEAERLELDDLELVGRGPGRVLRVTVDADGGVDLDRLAEVSRGLSRMFDGEDLLDGSYHLEVTSPGLERKLSKPAHYVKSIGREAVVKVRLSGVAETVRGVISAADDQDFSIDERRFSYEDVTSARTVFRWERAPKPGKRGKR